MAYLGASELEILLPRCITPFNTERIENASYELSLGNQYYLTDSETGKKEFLNDINSQIEIKAGQFALLLTDEIVTIPIDKIAFISIKFGLKVKGLVNVSGFHVDPGFNGKIIFSVYNAGSKPILMEKGKPYFVIWFAELKTELNAQDAYNGIHQGQTEISVGYIEALKGEIASPNALLTKIKDLERDTNDRIKVLDGKKDYNKWLLQAIIGLLTAISLKLFWDNNQFDKGYELGVKEKLAKQEVQKAISELSLDSIVSIKVHNSITTNIKNINRTKSDSTKRSEKAK